MSRPPRRTRPASGRSWPAARCSMVVLPAPLGPTTPRASPSSRRTSRPSMTLRAPNDFDSPSSSSSGATRPLAVRNGLERAGLGDLRVVLVGHDHQLERVLAGALAPLAADQRGLGHVRHRAAAPGDL